MGNDGGWWPAGCTRLADTCTRAKGIKRRADVTASQELKSGIGDCQTEGEGGIWAFAPFSSSGSENCGRDDRMAGRQAYRQGRQVSKWGCDAQPACERNSLGFTRGA